MTAVQTINLFIALIVVSGVFAGIYWLQEKIKIPSRQRIRFLKVHLIAVWTFAFASIVVLVLNAGSAIGKLFPSGAPLEGLQSMQPGYVLLEKSANISIQSILVYLYLFGALAALIKLVRSYLKMRSTFLNSSVYSVDGKTIRLIDRNLPPFSFGFLNPQIFIPDTFMQQYSEAEISVVVTHEETHIKNRDPQWKLFSVLTQSLLFFSPSIWYLSRKLDLEMEIECDRMTMGETQLSSQQYGGLLIDAVLSIQKNQTSPMFMYMSQTNLKRRIQAMKDRTSDRPLVNIIFGMIVSVVSVIAFGAASNVSKVKGLVRVETKIYISGKLVSTPTVVMAPSEPTTMNIKSGDDTEEMNITVVAFDADPTPIPDGIEVNIDWDYREDGRRYKANPRIITRDGEDATIELGAANQETVKMIVNAERI